MKLVVAEEIAVAYPKLRIAVLLCRAIENGATSAATSAELAAAEAEAREQVKDAAAVQALPEVAAWREVYKGFGANPNRTRPSSEALLRRVAKGDALPRITALVDLYNAATLRWYVPVGGYDIATLQGDVMLRRSGGGESFVGIGAEKPEPTSANEIVYADDARVLTRNWNYRDASDTRITEHSRDVVLFIEAPVEAVASSRLEAMQGYLADRATALLGARVETGWLDVGTSSIWQP